MPTQSTAVAEPAKTPPLVLELTPDVPIPAPTELFQPGGTAPIVAAIREAVIGEVPDLSTDKGRKRIASLSRKVASSKTALDNYGKDYVAEQKRLLRIIDGERKVARDALDALRDEVREPLTKWEEADAQRKADIQAKIDRLRGAANVSGLDIDGIRERIGKLEAFQPSKDVFQEFQSQAQEAIDATLASLRQSLQGAELAAERAALEAQRAEMERERQAAEAEKAEFERARREMIAAKERAEAAAQAADEGASKPLAEVRADPPPAAPADTRPVSPMPEIVNALLLTTTVSEPQARSVANALMEGRIPYVRVEVPWIEAAAE